MDINNNNNSNIKNIILEEPHNNKSTKKINWEKEKKNESRNQNLGFKRRRIIS